MRTPYTPRPGDARGLFEKLSQKEQKAKRRENAWQIAMMEEYEEDEDELMCDIIPEGNVVSPEVQCNIGPEEPRQITDGTSDLLGPASSCCRCCPSPRASGVPTSTLSILEHAEVEDVILATAPEEVTVSAAADTGAVASCLHPNQLPRGAQPCGNKEDKHFTGAGGEHIESYGKCDLLVNGNLILGTNVCEVNRALHSISQIAGPEDGPGVHDVIFTNKKGVVLPAGLLEEILKKHKPVLEYDRRGGLYVTDIKLSSFTRQDQAQ